MVLAWTFALHYWCWLCWFCCCCWFCCWLLLVETFMIMTFKHFVYKNITHTHTHTFTTIIIITLQLIINNNFVSKRMSRRGQMKLLLYDTCNIDTKLSTIFTTTGITITVSTTTTTAPGLFTAAQNNSYQETK